MVWFHCNFPCSPASASIQGPTPLLGEGVPGVCRSTLWSQSLLPPLGGFQGSKSFPQLVHQARTEPSPQSTAGFCLAKGAHAAWGAASPHGRASCCVCVGGFLFVGKGQQPGVGACHLCSHWCDLPAFAALSLRPPPASLTGCSAIFSLCSHQCPRESPVHSALESLCPPKPSGFLGNSWQAYPPEGQEASLRTWSPPHSLCQPVLLVTVSSHGLDFTLRQTSENTGNPIAD